ncbi:MAG: DUF3486 family protein [Deltaproteobacteria bacterium]|nr:DUF3486 family protein [Deltaproteobacteria bacterium]
MTRQSTVKALPPELRAEVDRRLGEGRLTLDALVEYLEAEGWTISRSALGRYSQKFQEVAAKLRESREVATAFARELGPIPGDDMGRMLLELGHSLTFRVLNAADDGVGTREVMQLAKTIKALTDSRRIADQISGSIRAEEKKRLEAEMKERLAEAAGAAEGGFRAEAAREARRILGFSDE